MKNKKNFTKTYQEDHHLNIMPNGILNGIADQDLINTKLQYYGKSFTKKFPESWNKDIDLQ